MKKTLTALLLGLGLPILAGSCSPSLNTKPETGIERRLAEERIVFYDKFPQKEQEIMQGAFRELTARYSLGYDLTVLNLDGVDKSVAQHNGYAFPLLNEENGKTFIKMFGQEIYDKLKGRNVITVKGSELFEKTKSLNESLYVKNKTKDMDYEFYILHEIIHTLVYRIMTPELGIRISDIDVENKIYTANDNIGELVHFTDENGNRCSTIVYREGEKPIHPAHVSFYSYFCVGLPGLSDTEKTHCAEEQATETILYYLKGYIDENVEDKLLAEKIRLIRQALKPFEKKH